MKPRREALPGAGFGGKSGRKSGDRRNVFSSIPDWGTSRLSPPVFQGKTSFGHPDSSTSIGTSGQRLQREQDSEKPKMEPKFLRLIQDPWIKQDGPTPSKELLLQVNETVKAHKLR